MQFTELTILAILSFTPSVLGAPAPSLCLSNGDNSPLTDCLTPDSQYCHGSWDGHVGGGDTQIQQWVIGANNVNAWDQTKMNTQLIQNGCAPSDIKSNYDPATLIASAKWVSSSSCTAGRVTDAFHDAAGKRQVDCLLDDHPALEGVEETGAILEAAIHALSELAG